MEHDKPYAVRQQHIQIRVQDHQGFPSGHFHCEGIPGQRFPAHAQRELRHVRGTHFKDRHTRTHQRQNDQHQPVKENYRKIPVIDQYYTYFLHNHNFATKQ